jgi:LmbE family N-acetylglucosaminyl deacetylase
VRVLHLAPHPDDELVGAPAALLSLHDAGHRVDNLALGLGRAADHARRAAEVREACRRAGLGLRVADPPVAMSGGDDLAAAEARVREELRRELDGPDPPALVVGPCHHDVHPAHELVGRAVRDVLAARDAPPPWWMWAVWGALPAPTVVVPYDAAMEARIAAALAAHAGEMRRTDHVAALAARGRRTAILAAELALGFGSGAAPPGSRAEVVTELIRANGRWYLGLPRLLDPAAPLGPPSRRGAGRWLAAPGAGALLDPRGPVSPGWSAPS